jgi:nitroreductase
MTRAFRSTPIDPGIVDELLDDARRAPSAGNTASVQFLVLTGSEETSVYWDTTLPAERRESFPWPDLLQAPVIIVPWVDPSAYVARYAEGDKAHAGLGETIDEWPVPYWFVDGGAAVMTLLLGAEAAGLGALFFGLFSNERAVQARFGVPEHRRAVGAVALGHAAPGRSSQSARRSRAALDDVVHRAQWSRSPKFR